MLFHCLQSDVAAKVATIVVLLGLSSTPSTGFTLKKDMSVASQVAQQHSGSESYTKLHAMPSTSLFNHDSVSSPESDSASSSSTSLSAASISIPLGLDLGVDYQPFDVEAAEAVVDDCSSFQVFCDLDGVLVDFEAGVQTICHRSTKELPKWAMWDYVSRVDGFFENLKWTAEGPELWQAIQHLSPDILTGIPDLESSRLEKFQWCKDKLGTEQEFHHVDMAGRWYSHSSVNGNQVRNDNGVCNVITCWSYNKHHHSGKNRILIDDRIALKKGWESKGGIFVHHTNLERTLQQLKDLGVL